MRYIFGTLQKLSSFGMRCAIGGSVLTLIACSQREPLTDELNRYLDKLNQLPAVNSSPIESSTYPTNYPRVRELLVKRERISISITDFLSLYQCELNQLVGEQNSALIQTQGTSRQWFYDRKFIVLATTCIDILQDGETSKKLTAAIHSKQNDLASSYWNASFASKEFKKAFSPYSPPLTPEELANQNSPVATIMYFYDQWSLDENKIDNNDLDTFNLRLGELASVNYPGKLLRTLHQFNEFYAKVNPSLNQAQQSNLCIGSTIEDKALYNNFNLRIRPIQEQLRAQAKTIEQLGSLAYELQPESTAFRQYWDASWAENGTSTLSVFIKETDKHTALMKKFNETCLQNPVVQFLQDVP